MNSSPPQSASRFTWPIAKVQVEISPTLSYFLFAPFERTARDPIMHPFSFLHPKVGVRTIYNLGSFRVFRIFCFGVEIPSPDECGPLDVTDTFIADVVIPRGYKREILVFHAQCWSVKTLWIDSREITEGSHIQTTDILIAPPHYCRF